MAVFSLWPINWLAYAKCCQFKEQMLNVMQLWKKLGPTDIIPRHHHLPASVVHISLLLTLKYSSEHKNNFGQTYISSNFLSTTSFLPHAHTSDFSFFFIWQIGKWVNIVSMFAKLAQLQHYNYYFAVMTNLSNTDNWQLTGQQCAGGLCWITPTWTHTIKQCSCHRILGLQHSRHLTASSTIHNHRLFLSLKRYVQ